VIDAFDLAGRDLIGEHHRKGSEAGAPTSRNPPVRFSFPPRPLPTAESPPPVRRQAPHRRATTTRTQAHQGRQPPVPNRGRTRRESAQRRCDIRREAEGARQGRATARERIYALLDDDSFVELDALARHRSSNFGLAENRPLGDGVVSPATAPSTGSEGRISYRKRGYGRDHICIDGTEGARIWTRHGILAQNLVKVSALLPDRPLRDSSLPHHSRVAFAPTKPNRARVASSGRSRSK
jgi:Carboxyl transferase domain